MSENGARDFYLCMCVYVCMRLFRALQAKYRTRKSQNRVDLAQPETVTSNESTIVGNDLEGTYNYNNFSPKGVRVGTSDVTPGNFAENNDIDMNKNENGEDTSDSSEAEINELRSQMMVQTLATQVTPGMDENVQSQVTEMVGIGQEGAFDSNENEMIKMDGNNINKNDKFSEMLSDKLVAIDLVEDDIVHQMKQDIENPNEHVTKGYHQTPGNLIGASTNEMQENGEFVN